MTRWLARVLCLALVPVLVVAAGVRADAQKTVGSTVTYAFQNDNNPLNAPDRVKCNGSARWVTNDGTGPGTVPPTSGVEWSLTCSTAWDVSSAYVGMIFKTGTTGCGDLTTQLHQFDGNPVQTGTTNLIAGTVVAGVPTAVTCSVSEMCWTMTIDGHSFQFARDAAGCIPLALGAPPAYVSTPTASLSCPALTVTKPVAVGAPYLRVRTPAGGYQQYIQDYQATLTFNGSQPANGWWVYSIGTSNFASPGTIANYGTYAPASGISDTTRKWWQILSLTDSRLNQNAPFRWSGTVVPGASGSSVTVTWSQQLGYETATTQTPSSTGIVPVGFGIARMLESWGNNSGASQLYGTGSGVINSNGLLGKAQPEQCAWYWGTQLVNDPGTAYDTPLGQMGYEPPPVEPPPLVNQTQPNGEEDNCGFSFTDPSSWGGAAACAAVSVLGKVLGVLKSILDAVLGLAQAIVNGIKDALQALFVPDSDALEDNIDDVKDAWADTPPGLIVDTVGELGDDFNQPTSSSCQGPALDVRLPYLDPSAPGGVIGMGTQRTLYPLSTCNPAVDKVSDIFRTGLKLGVWLAVIMLSMRVLAASLGLRVPIGNGAGDD